jgi:CBS domain-containing protein
MQLKDIMTRTVETIHPEASLQEAAAKLRELNVGSLPVVENGRVVGVVTDRDITVRSTAKGDNPLLAKVREAMTEEVVFGYEDQDVREAARLMEEKQIRRLIVVDHDKRLAGIVALGDLAVDTGDRQLAGEALERISEPAQPRQ